MGPRALHTAAWNFRWWENLLWLHIFLWVIEMSKFKFQLPFLLSKLALAAAVFLKATNLWPCHWECFEGASPPDGSQISFDYWDASEMLCPFGEPGDAYLEPTHPTVKGSERKAEQWKSAQVQEARSEAEKEPPWAKLICHYSVTCVAAGHRSILICVFI